MAITDSDNSITRTFADIDIAHETVLCGDKNDSGKVVAVEQNYTAKTAVTPPNNKTISDTCTVTVGGLVAHKAP